MEFFVGDEFRTPDPPWCKRDCSEPAELIAYNLVTFVFPLLRVQIYSINWYLQE
jgi:hypothetical protein